MDTLNIKNMLNAYKQLDIIPAHQLINTVFRDLPVSAQVDLIQKRKEAPNIGAFIEGLGNNLQTEMDGHFTTLYRQKTAIDITLP